VARRVERRGLVVRAHRVVAHRLAAVAVRVAVHRQIPPGHRGKKEKTKKNVKSAVVVTCTVQRDLHFANNHYQFKR